MYEVQYTSFYNKKLVVVRKPPSFLHWIGVHRRASGWQRLSGLCRYPYSTTESDGILQTPTSFLCSKANLGEHARQDRLFGSSFFSNDLQLLTSFYTQEVSVAQ
ncbi:hypothetical protein ACMFMG_007217 [Clarireedia jacksonii]